ncbi:hypothetical protein ACA910_002191 [Epithemia clementina (nom. ined.)]
MDIVDRTITGHTVQGPTKAESGDHRPNFASLQQDGIRMRLILPSVFAVTKWCERPLTTSEALSALDLPATLIQKWNAGMQKVVLKHLTSPVKIVTAVARCIREFLITREHLLRGTVKRSWASTNLVSEVHPAHVPSIVHTRTAKRAKKNTVGIEVKNASTESQAGEHIAWGELTRIRMQDYSIRDWLNKSTATESAVKCDDAEVPTHLWDYRIFFLLGESQLQTKHTRAFKTLRYAMWKRWRQNVLTSWKIWWEQQASKIRAVAGKKSASCYIREEPKRACTPGAQAFGRGSKGLLFSFDDGLKHTFGNCPWSGAKLDIRAQSDDHPAMKSGRAGHHRNDGRQNRGH